ncbi:MAG TPA: amidohydrolase family protein, partial [Bacteroidales bacterium]|nr:amidohydrolase family protein [Bacteroidales bacterium]
MKEKAVTSIEGIHFETGNPVSVEIVDGLISKIKETAGTKSAADKLFIAPGLIDNQINGYGGVDYSEDSLSVEGVVNSAKSIWKHGVTTFVPTLVTSSNETLLRNFGILAEALDENEQLRESIIGFHLEGPYISPDEGFRGCHPVQHVRKPSLKEFDQYQKAAGGR